ncbi:hypothetical protein [Cohnella sp. JJ-181]|uniref:hypothetical protein n=1 Tax=Cohnella rhizoplanae TaxID=2974897 RepID=UPI0022FFBAE0|nr:hypothetical protein [Cohnella sp. JJ-181]CAI6021553.1 hypothetical protein COHCIP112018_00334 [Cohnella sp. JJ-181]
MNTRRCRHPYRMAKLLILTVISAALAGCSLFPKPDDTAPVLTTVYAPSVGKDVYSSLSPSHFLE